MSEVNDRLELLIPSGKLVIGHARCPQGCDLMDPKVRIHGHPAIQLKVTHGGQTGAIHLDPVYGLHENRSEIEIPAGEVAEFSCPHCGVTMTEEGAHCSKCSAPMMVLALPEGSAIEACRRNGCPGHRLRIVTGEEQMQRLFDDLGMDAFL